MAKKRATVKLLGDAKEEYLKLQQIVKEEEENEITGSFHQAFMEVD